MVVLLVQIIDVEERLRVREVSGLCAQSICFINLTRPDRRHRRGGKQREQLLGDRMRSDALPNAS